MNEPLFNGRDISAELSEEKRGQRELWLSEVGRSESDVMEDEEGTEYVYVDNETEPGEHEDAYKKIILPEVLQRYYFDTPQ